MWNIQSVAPYVFSSDFKNRKVDVCLQINSVQHKNNVIAQMKFQSLVPNEDTFKSIRFNSFT